MASDEHRQAEVLAAEAHSLARSGRRSEAMARYHLAAEFEQRALANVPHERPRTRGILGISLASLLYKARALQDAERVICQLLSEDGLLAHARRDLRDLLEAIWDEQQIDSYGLASSGESFLVSHRGGAIGYGTAPPELVQQSISGVSSLYYRVGEWEGQYPLRKTGPSLLKDRFQARMGPTLAGSYRYTLKFVEQKQRLLFSSENDLSAGRISESLLRILRAAIDGNQSELLKAVPDQSYRHAILKLIRNILPSGRSVRETLITRYSSNAATETLTLLDGHRIAINQALRVPAERGGQSETVFGVLRGLRLNQRWLEIDGDDGTSQKCWFESDVLDDVVGPMVNRRVRADGHWSSTNGNRKFILNDIELTEDGKGEQCDADSVDSPEEKHTPRMI